MHCNYIIIDRLIIIVMFCFFLFLICSGHGISGMGLLAVHSIVATPCMFIGGIGTAILSQYLP